MEGTDRDESAPTLNIIETNGEVLLWLHGEAGATGEAMSEATSEATRSGRGVLDVRNHGEVGSGNVTDGSIGNERRDQL